MNASLPAKRICLILALIIGMVVNNIGGVAAQDVPTDRPASTVFIPLITNSSATTPVTAAGKPVEEVKDAVYLIVFTEKVSGVEEVAKALVEKYDGSLRHIYQYAIKGFAAAFRREAIREMSQLAEIDYIVADGVAELMQIQSPVPSWGLDRIDQRDLPLNNQYGFNATGANVHVYVIDSGIRATHNDFGGRVSGGVAIVGTNTDDCIGHGTHVAGTIGGATYGVAKQVQLHPVRVFGCSPFGTWADVIAGVDWVTNHHVAPSVVNMSLGGFGNLALDQAVQNSINQGITYVVAAGNSNQDACLYSPARVGPALTVGASTITDVAAGFSNQGSCLDLFAPGVNIVSAGHGSDTAQLPNSGTSMAAPHVAGVAALFLEGNASASPHMVANQIVGTATPNRLTGLTLGSPNLLLYTEFSPPQCSTFVDSGQNLGNSNGLAVALADFNGDGTLDAAVGNFRQPATIWFNNGAGIFTLQQSLSTDEDVAVGAADLDGDGDVDLAIADNTGPTTVWINDGTGFFNNSGQALGNGNHLDLALADLNGDGTSDIVVAGNGNNQIWLNSGSGTFMLTQTLVTTASWGVAIGDLDGDNDVDLYFTNAGADTVWLNSGTGSFVNSGQALGNSIGRSVALGDVDGDQDLDAFVLNKPGQMNLLWLNDGAGSFSSSGQTLSTLNGEVALADLNGDGDLDAFIANLNGANQIWHNDGAGFFSNSGQYLGNSRSSDVALGDVDGDGDIDAFVANQNAGPDKVWLCQ